MDNHELNKNIGLVPALSIVVGMVIGGGVFFKPTAIFTATGAPGLGIIAWIIAGIITIAGGLTVAELGAAIPKTGGAITYLNEAYGDIWGFLFGWAQTVIYFPGTMAALAIIFATQVVTLLGLGNNLIVPIGIIAVVFLTVLNIIGGSKAGSALQTISTAGKLIPLFLIIVVGFIKGDGGVARLFPITAPDHPVTTGLGSALIACMFAYNGWINVGTIAGEMKNPGKDLPKAIIGGLSLVMAVYILINVAYLFVLPASKLAATASPAADVATIIFGSNGGKLISIGILVSIFGCLNGNILTGSRIPYALATENKLPFSGWFAELHKKTGAPVNATIFLSLLGIGYIFTGKFDQLTDLTIFVVWLFYVMTFVAVFILRKNQPDLHRPYKVPLYPIIPIIAILGGLYIIINTLITQPLNAGLGLIFTLIGIPIYTFKKSKSKQLEKRACA
jgi:APA family basic amino acid/polyamine antiporter